MFCRICTQDVTEVPWSSWVPDWKRGRGERERERERERGREGRGGREGGTERGNERERESHLKFWIDKHKTRKNYITSQVT